MPVSSKLTSDNLKKLRKSCVLPQVTLWSKGILYKNRHIEQAYDYYAWLSKLLSDKIDLSNISCGFKDLPLSFDLTLKNDENEDVPSLEILDTPLS